MTDKKALIISLILLALMTLIGIITILIVVVLPNLAPEQHEQVEVVGKRTRTAYRQTEWGQEERKIPDYLVAFKFPDGTEKELKVHFDIFNDLQEGDTGTLSYKESKNAKTFERRRFIRFEKDS